MQTLEEQQKPSEASEPTKKRPVLFSKEHLGKSPHARWLNSTIRSNRRGKNNNLLMTYQKANGEVVERRIKPLSANKHLLLAHDYNRNNVRSFHIDRIQKMEKAATEGQTKSAFELGFEKRAYVTGGLSDAIIPAVHTGLVGAMIGGTVLPAIGLAYYGHKASKLIKESPKKSLEDYAEVKAKFPDLKFHTYKELVNESKKSKLKDEKEYFTEMSNMLKDGDNAFYHRIPFVGQKPVESIYTPDQVNEGVLGHEIGHYLTKKYLETAKGKDKKRIEGSTLAEEEEAWKRSPLPYDPKMRDAALGTYRASEKFPIYGAVAGGLVGAGLGAWSVLSQAEKLRRMATRFHR